MSASGAAVSPVRRQQRGGAAERPRRLSDQQPRAAADRAAVRERTEPAGARGERRPAVLSGLHAEHAGGAAHYQHAAGGEEEVFVFVQAGSLMKTQKKQSDISRDACVLTYWYSLLLQ